MKQLFLIALICFGKVITLPSNENIAAVVRFSNSLVPPLFQVRKYHLISGTQKCHWKYENHTIVREKKEVNVIDKWLQLIWLSFAIGILTGCFTTLLQYQLFLKTFKWWEYHHSTLRIYFTVTTNTINKCTQNHHNNRSSVLQAKRNSTF